MKSLKRKCLSILAFIVLPLFILGCSEKKPKPPDVTEEIKLNAGAVLKSEEGTYKLYNYENGKYEQTKTNNIILAYDKSSSNYISIEDSKAYAINSGQKFEIKASGYSQLKLSKDGKYISYFIEDNGLKLKIFDINEKKEIEMKSNVSISGTLYDWYDVNTLVYYGVSNDGVNGLFTYNIKENTEELLYKIKEGYLAFIKGTIDNVIFLQLTLENKKELIMIDKKTKDVKLLTDNIEELSDIIINKEKIYFTGKISDNINSVYELNNNKAKRLVYDFPTVVKIKKGLKVDENGNILFVGSNNASSNEEQVYTYAQDGSISTVSKNSTDFVFLDYRS
ncbi:hypothetical protein CLPUN_11780 [Clostridium puniceum]|uniref:Lipoprotein n=1 Tax=Clostridium puniceum TaxID=29367 RepID=A0A1S8TTK5_9CLOT|nr:hypothetical protein [Clostridium puniceum]OOM81018.1 hypothetical protein CLPUN_11780 [Clostridium puniceum]